MTLAARLGTATLALAGSVLSAGPAAAAVPGCGALTIRSEPAANGSARLVATVPVELGQVSVPASAFTIYSDGQTSTVQVTRLPAAELGVVIVVARSADSTLETYRDAVSAARELVVGLPPEASVAVVSAVGPARLLAGASRDRERALRSLAPLQLEGGDSLDDAVRLAAQQTGQRPQTRIVIVTGGSAHGAGPIALAPPGTAQELAVGGNGPGGDGCPAPGGNASLVSSVDAVAARLSGQYEVSVPASLTGTPRLQVDYLNVSSSALLTSASGGPLGAAPTPSNAATAPTDAAPSATAPADPEPSAAQPSAAEPSDSSGNGVMRVLLFAIAAAALLVGLTGLTAALRRRRGATGYLPVPAPSWPMPPRSPGRARTPARIDQVIAARAESRPTTALPQTGPRAPDRLRDDQPPAPSVEGDQPRPVQPNEKAQPKAAGPAQSNAAAPSAPDPMPPSAPAPTAPAARKKPLAWSPKPPPPSAPEELALVAPEPPRAPEPPATTSPKPPPTPALEKPVPSTPPPPPSSQVPVPPAAARPAQPSRRSGTPGRAASAPSESSAPTLPTSPPSDAPHQDVVQTGASRKGLSLLTGLRKRLTAPGAAPAAEPSKAVSSREAPDLTATLPATGSHPAAVAAAPAPGPEVTQPPRPAASAGDSPETPLANPSAVAAAAAAAVATRTAPPSITSTGAADAVPPSTSRPAAAPPPTVAAATPVTSSPAAAALLPATTLRPIMARRAARHEMVAAGAAPLGLPTPPTNVDPTPVQPPIDSGASQPGRNLRPATTRRSRRRENAQDAAAVTPAVPARSAGQPDARQPDTGQPEPVLAADGLDTGPIDAAHVDALKGEAAQPPPFTPGALRPATSTRARRIAARAGQPEPAQQPGRRRIRKETDPTNPPPVS